MSKFQRVNVMLGTLCLVFGLAQSAAAHDENPLLELQTRWWQWIVSIPLDQNPLNDESGTNCGVGQRGEYWYLAGNFGGSATTRECTVPKGVKLLVPVFVTFCYPEEGYDDDASCIAYVNDLVGSYRSSDLSLKLDGRRQQIRDVCELAVARGDAVSGAPRQCRLNQNAKRTVFTIVIGPNSILPSEPGPWRVNAIRGVWGVIDTDRLSVGEHVLDIRAIGDGQDTPTENVTYKLTVAKSAN